MSIAPQTAARKALIVLLREAREAGWARIKGEIKPDGSLTLDAGMAEAVGADDFLCNDLRMGN